MNATFAWQISQLERAAADGYVFTAHYVVNASTPEHSTGAYGSLGLERPESALIPFESLTEQTVVSWVKDKLTAEKVAEVEAALQAQLEEMGAPSKLSGLPW